MQIAGASWDEIIPSNKGNGAFFQGQLGSSNHLPKASSLGRIFFFPIGMGNDLYIEGES